ncbi:hypothetical protein IGI43_001179 [Enterococcus sp. AZ126]
MKEYFFYGYQVNSFFDEGSFSGNQTELGINGIVT